MQNFTLLHSSYVTQCTMVVLAYRIPILKLIILYFSSHYRCGVETIYLYLHNDIMTINKVDIAIEYNHNSFMYSQSVYAVLARGLVWTLDLHDTRSDGGMPIFFLRLSVSLHAT